MRKLAIFAAAIQLTVFVPASATIINIPDDYLTIQEGIDASADGDTVLVQPGTYVENVNFNGHNIVLGSLFFTTQDTTYIADTIIDGSFGATVVFESGIDDNAAITGFTITTSEYTGFDRGIYCNSAAPIISSNIIRDNYVFGPGAGILLLGDSEPLIVNNTIVDNNSSENVDNGGGGISCQNYSSPLILDNVIARNGSDFGGGIFCGDSSSAQIMDNTIADNIAGISGGGIYCSSSGEVVIHNNTISLNRSLWTGGGIGCRDSSPSITGNIISSNIALDWYPYQNEGGGIYLSYDSTLLRNNLIRNNMSLYGGGICCSHSNSMFINNCILGNTGDSLGGAFFCRRGSNVDVINSIVWSNHNPLDSIICLADSSAITIAYSNIRRGWEGEGNINVPPQFRSPAYGDYHLMSTACGDPNNSACIDAGDPAIIDSLLDCSWGLGELRSDMGAYGGGDTVIVGMDDKEIPTPDKFMLFQNYPNPFNATTVIRYSLPEPADVKIDIFDILGRRVETIIDQRHEAGYHHVVWSGSRRSAGIYLYRIQAGDHTQTRKLILLK